MHVCACNANHSREAVGQVCRGSGAVVVYRGVGARVVARAIKLVLVLVGAGWLAAFLVCDQGVGRGAQIGAWLI